MKNQAFIILALMVLSVAGNKLYSQITINTGNSTINDASKITIGQSVSHVEVNNLLNTSRQSVKLGDLKNKIVILEFWATWCGPCLPAMDELAKLQKKYPNDLVVIAIAHENVARLKRYIANKPSGLWHTADETSDLYAKYFPHYTVPHSVIIDKNSEVAAITYPDEINEEVIQKLLSGQKVNLRVKEENVASGFDFKKDYFPPAPGTKESFILQPPLKGGMPIVRKSSKEYPDRRITFINQNLRNIYAQIYNIPFQRIVYENVTELEIISPESKFSYCLDAIAPEGMNLNEYIQKKVSEVDLEIKAKLKKQKMHVWQLVVIPGQTLHLTRAQPNQNSQPVIARVTEYKSKGVTLDQFTDNFLNRFPIQGLSTVNATGIKRKI